MAKKEDFKSQAQLKAGEKEYNGQHVYITWSAGLEKYCVVRLASHPAGSKVRDIKVLRDARRTSSVLRNEKVA